MLTIIIHVVAIPVVFAAGALFYRRHRDRLEADAAKLAGAGSAAKNTVKGL